MLLIIIIIMVACVSFLIHFRQSIVKFTHDTGTPSMAFINEINDGTTVTYVRTSNSLSYICSMLCILTCIIL